MCYSNRDLTKPQPSYSNMYPCPKCGKTILRKKGALEKHKEICGKRYIRNKLICLRPPKANAKFYIFYDKGSIHCLTKFGFQKYLGIGQSTLSRRLEEGWNIQQLLGKEYVDPLPNERQGKKKKKDDINPLGTKQKQELLMRVFRAKR